MTRWWLCKYVPDLLRNEPRNIGVVLLKDGVFSARFLETTPAFVRSVENYEDWIRRWRYDIGRAKDEWDIQRLARKPGDSYYLECSGQFLWAAADEPLTVTIDALFERLVEVKP